MDANIHAIYDLRYNILLQEIALSLSKEMGLIGRNILAEGFETLPSYNNVVCHIDIVK